ncbi:GntR family transcriptional regulator [Nesterenkonia sp. NBAIMH1]|uniref:GntR family transcriptional regulator n=2 Tax=Nesterenkonia TaxID=57494 RepID=UPI0011B7CDE2|nr:GntR family transcriptional regulator [Nesterenkonia sp. NBAIMH1]
MSDEVWASLQPIGSEPEDHAHLPERAAAALREQVAAGLAVPGAKLPEVRITQQLGISRHTLRSAFQILAGEGLVQRRPNRGVFVYEPQAEDIRELYRVRRVIQTGALRAADFSAEATAALQEIVDRAHAALAEGDAHGMAEANQQFHQLIVAQARSSTLDSLMSQVLARMRLAFLTRRHESDFHTRYVRRNGELAELLRGNRRAEAETYLMEYLVTAENDLIAHLERA